MENKEISEKYANVLKHRIRKSSLPNVEQLKKLAMSGFTTKKELKGYINTAKRSYDDVLLYLNSTTSKKIME